MNAKITFRINPESVILNLDNPLLPADMSDADRLEYWLAGARENPIEAMIALGIEIEVTGELCE